MTDTKPTPYAWTVTGTAQMFFGDYAKHDAEQEAKHIGGTARAFPLFAEEPVAQKAPTNADLEDIAKNPELYEDYAPGRTSIEYLSPVLFGRAVLARFGTAPQPDRNPLTDDKVYEAIKGIDSLDALAVWRAAEAAHGIKGKK